MSFNLTCHWTIEQLTTERVLNQTIRKGKAVLQYYGNNDKRKRYTQHIQHAHTYQVASQQDWRGCAWATVTTITDGLQTTSCIIEENSYGLSVIFSSRCDYVFASRLMCLLVRSKTLYTEPNLSDPPIKSQLWAYAKSETFNYTWHDRARAHAKTPIDKAPPWRPKPHIPLTYRLQITDMLPHGQMGPTL